MENASKVIEYFKEICAIPHASYDEKAISDYLMDFAAKRNLFAERDAMNNVLIRKPASVENCSCAPVIIQGHVDMVYVRAEGCDRPYEAGIAVTEKNGWLRAEGTTLGADNGIAVAYALALLDRNDIPHPELEVVLTVQEEVGLAGAAAFDCSKLRGKHLINLDTEDEGVFFTSCAGAFRNDIKIPLEREEISGMTELQVSLGGMLGGHSGMEIHLGRGNAIILMGRLLTSALDEGIRIHSITCDGKMNAIASNCKAVLYIEKDKIDSVLDRFNASVAAFNRELKGVDVVELETVLGEKESLSCYTHESMARALAVLSLLPNGVFGMTADGQLVETSANPGIVTQEENRLIISSSVRSSLGSRKEEIRSRLSALALLCGGESVCTNDYPQWEYRAHSPLRELAMNSYRELFGVEPVTRAIHAGLECGFFDMKVEGLDIISFGPNQRDVHTPKERISITSIGNVWRLILRILEKLAL